MAKQQASAPIDPQTRLAAAWPNGVPPGLQRRIERAQSEAERTALTADVIDKGERRLARQAEQPSEPETVSVTASKGGIVIAIDGLEPVTLTRQQAAQLRKALTGQGV